MKQMKNKRAGIYGRSKNISAKNNFIPTNSTSEKSLSLQTFDDYQTPLASQINITKTNGEK